MQVKYYNSGNSQWESANPLPPEEIYIGNTPPAQGINAKLWLDTSVTGLLPASYAVADNCEQTVAGQAVLDAHQGYLLQNQVSNLDNSIDSLSDIVNPVSTHQYGIEVTIASGPVTALKNSFNAAGNYTNYSGYTSAGIEMGWYGFKHTSSKAHNYGICFSNAFGAAIYDRTADDTWKFYIIFR